MVNYRATKSLVKKTKVYDKKAKFKLKINPQIISRKEKRENLTKKENIFIPNLF